MHEFAERLQIGSIRKRVKELCVFVGGLLVGLPQDANGDYKDIPFCPREHSVFLEFKEAREVVFERFQLEDTLSVRNMTCIDADQKIRTFQSPEEILFAFYQARSTMYAGHVQQQRWVDRLDQLSSALDTHH